MAFFLNLSFPFIQSMDLKMTNLSDVMLKQTNHLSVFLFFCLSVFLSFYRSIVLSFHLSGLSVFLSFCLSVFLSFYRFVVPSFWSFCLHVLLSLPNLTYPNVPYHNIRRMLSGTLVAHTPSVWEDLGLILHCTPGWHFFSTSHFLSFSQWT